MVRAKIKKGVFALEKLLTAEEVALLAQLELHAVYRYARTSRLPSIRIGTKLRFPESALQKWINDQLAGTAPAQPTAASAAAV